MEREVFLARHGALLLVKQISLSQGRSNPVRHFALGDLRDATNNFDESRILQRGNYHWGILEGRRVTIMKASGVEDAISEIAVLSNFHHNNIVKLIGCCLETELPWLVYEFFPGCTLSDNLRLWRENGGAERPSWSIRLRIVMGVADALTYLHCSTSRVVLHRDVKSSNIILDETYTPKLSGFSLSVSIPLGEKFSDSPIAGTLGYLAPEYLRTGMATEKNDVYAFGGLLFQLLTERERVFDLTHERADALSVLRDIHILLKPQCPGDSPAVVDVIEDYVTREVCLAIKEGHLTMLVEHRCSMEGGRGNRKQLRAVAELLWLCCHYNPEERPTMKEVASELRRINSLVLGP